MGKKENTFLLVSLEDEKAKSLASVITSEACRKILDYLAGNDATESELSKALTLPISTVHYNLKQLVTAGLVKADEFHYSEKGREVNHYSLSNRYIIIAPKTTEGIASKLKRILPAVGLTAGAAAIIQLLKPATNQIMIMRPAMKEATEGVSIASEAFKATPTDAIQAAYATQPSPALWFLAGALFFLAATMVYDSIRERAKRKRQID
ncbi:helix-turn-helix transcriptional regulator [Candidatus Woesearchaeota archaeon]|nr:helix-turn-helix transcriptional regulator [Candidatus Woesearchaeota archaeon]